jgi:hypothetical protein
MRYLGLLPFTFVMWMLVWGAGAESNRREAQRTGKKTSGTSGPLVGFLLGWVLTIVAYFWDHRDFWGTFPTNWTLRLTPYGFWTVFGFHALLGAAALSFGVYDILQYRREERRRGPGPSHQG